MGEQRKIAIIEDEEDIRELLADYLQKAGFEVSKFEDGSSFLKFLEKEKPDLIILDLMLPDMDGKEICRYLRSDSYLSSILIMMLTAKGSEEEKVQGLELGADDYVTKPFSLKEVLARVKALLRRAIPNTEARIKIGNILWIDPQTHKVYVNENEIELTSTEFKILQILASKKGMVFTREKLLDALWGNEKIVTERSIDVHIKKLRDKLKEAGCLIKTIRGVGYKLEDK
jgi:two-component system phosphate regulon response regulator PhoB/two-component system alkaline phosphatase synthesis response regulator PhoP